MGKTVADVLSKEDKQIVMEGQEPAQFWVALGGKAPYASDKRYLKTFQQHLLTSVCNLKHINITCLNTIHLHQVRAGDAIAHSSPF